MSPNATPITHAHFWLCTIGLLLVWIVVISTALPREEKSPSLMKFWGKNQAQEQRLENSCKSLCEQCGCIGFYCGEQCLCEYNKLTSDQTRRSNSYARRNDTKVMRAKRSHTECIAAMQDEAHTKNLPYEVLIQGPTSDHFIHTAMQLAQDMARTAASIQVGVPPQKRSTISIYRPFVPMKHNNELVHGNDNRKLVKDAIARMRRSTDHLDWFSDFASALVRPAPRRKAEESAVSGGNKKRETQRNKEEDNATRESPESWFTDHPKMLLRPAPLFRRRASQPQQKTQTKQQVEPEYENESRESEEVADAPLAPVRKALKNTIRNIQDSELGENIREGLRTGLRDGGDLLQNTFNSGNSEVLPKRFHDDFVEVFDSWMKSQQKMTEPPAASARSAPPSVMLPWLRPVRFLQRVQQALNRDESKE
ncbi:uncharacterized protein [Eurosta solidaginis]|uniref:uncharacterized protein n=1 Tax=Eurosta solidaginis TaxID=178769 RepID=UPI0035312290